jgi:hypothetical protein
MLRTAAWPCCLAEKRRWGGRGGGITLRTWTNVDSDDDLCHHCLDDVARQRTCQVVALSCRPSSVGLVMWRCHVVVVVGMHDGGGHRSNDVCARWPSLLAGGC